MLRCWGEACLARHRGNVLAAIQIVGVPPRGRPPKMIWLLSV